MMALGSLEEPQLETLQRLGRSCNACQCNPRFCRKPMSRLRNTRLGHPPKFPFGSPRF
uniref:Uncharacterized protein n=1 Tax=Rhizophora mucronata TaxID=61149 RepID=A0A2P2PKI4_RHIMU